MSNRWTDHDQRAEPLHFCHSERSLVSRWVLHAGISPARPAIASSPPSDEPPMPHINGWLELHEETLLGSTFRVAGLIGNVRPRTEKPSTRDHLRFQGNVTSIMPDGVLRMEGQVRAGSRLAPAVGELGIGQYISREGSEVLELRFELVECSLLIDPGIKTQLTAVRLRPAS
jgi:hypothetical protein